MNWQEVVREFHKQADAWYLDRPGGRISGRSIGSGPPLYFLNGIVGNHELFALLVWLLRDQFRCVLFDYPVARRGHSTLADSVEDLLAIADQSGDAKFHLFGTSYGGMVALAALAHHPQRVSRTILQGAFAHHDWSRFERILISAGDWMPGNVNRLPTRAAIQRQNHHRWFPPFDGTRLEFYLQNTGATRIRDLAIRAGIAGKTDFRSVLSQIQRPVMLVRSEGDGAVLAGYTETLAGSLPQVTVESMNDTGQIPYLTHPHRLAKLIRPFLAPQG